jgi:N-acyl homoserine lactone hydrolase
MQPIGYVRSPLARGVVIGVCAGSLAVIAMITLAVYARRPLPPLRAVSIAKPHLSNLSRIQVCWVETGHAFGAGTFSMTASGLLIRHPDGDALIDGGNSSHFDEEAAQFPFWRRLIMIAIPGRLKPRIPLPAALRATGEAPDRIRWLIPSHIHLDHIGGYEDLPRIPVLLSAPELAFTTDRSAQESGAVIPQQARMMRDGRAQVIPFSHHPYGVFAESYDLYQDGSITIVPMPGHTPGSVGVFVNLDSRQRIFYVGDAVLQGREITDRIRKPFFIPDVEPGMAADEVRKLNFLHRADPEVMLIPAHGRSDFLRAFPGGPGSCLSSRR